MEYLRFGRRCWLHLHGKSRFYSKDEAGKKVSFVFFFPKQRVV